MYDFKNFYINGVWVDPVTSNDFDVINPATEQAIGQISLGSAADLDQAVSAARQAFEIYSLTSREDRLELLQNILSEYGKREKDVAAAISDEMGAPMSLAGGAQVGTGVQHLRGAIAALTEMDFEQEVDGAQIVKEPIGVCGLITPWNWPMNQITCKVAPALAAGCTMVLKPSEVAPLSAYVFSEVLHAAGVPAGVYNMINGDGPGVGAPMSAHPGIDMVSFTGSTGVVA